MIKKKVFKRIGSSNGKEWKGRIAPAILCKSIKLLYNAKINCEQFLANYSSRRFVVPLFYGSDEIWLLAMLEPQYTFHNAIPFNQIAMLGAVLHVHTLCKSHSIYYTHCTVENTSKLIVFVKCILNDVSPHIFHLLPKMIISIDTKML